MLSDNFVVFGLDDVKVYQRVNPSERSIMMRRRLDSIYVMSPKLACVKKALQSDMVDLCGMRITTC